MDTDRPHLTPDPDPDATPALAELLWHAAVVALAEEYRRGRLSDAA